MESFSAMLDAIAELRRVDHVAPVQWSIRLLTIAGSRLLELEEVRRKIAPFDREALAYPWKHSDPRVDGLQKEIEAAVREAGESCKRAALFAHVRELARAALSGAAVGPY